MEKGSISERVRGQHFTEEGMPGWGWKKEDAGVRTDRQKERESETESAMRKECEMKEGGSGTLTQFDL